MDRHDKSVNKKDFREVLTEGRFIDYTIIFVIARRLLRKMEDWPAFKLGLIDEKGKILKKPKTPEEKDSLTLLDRFILSLRRNVAKNKWLLFTPLFLLKEAGPDWEDIKAKDEAMILEQVEKSEKAKNIVLDFKNRIAEDFEDEDEFWTEFLKIRS